MLIILALGVLTPLEFASQPSPTLSMIQLPIPTFAPLAIPSKLKRLLVESSIQITHCEPGCRGYVLSFVSYDQQDFSYTFRPSQLPAVLHNQHSLDHRSDVILPPFPVSSLPINHKYLIQTSSVLYFGTRGLYLFILFLDLSP